MIPIATRRVRRGARGRGADNVGAENWGGHGGSGSDRTKFDVSAGKPDYNSRKYQSEVATHGGEVHGGINVGPRSDESERRSG